MKIQHRERNQFRDEAYLIANTETEGEWLRMHWRADVPQDYKERNELGETIEP